MDVPPVDEALQELGLQGGEPPDVVRRAYLRLLKQRKPEVDPEGFRRLRAAYELLASGQLGGTFERPRPVEEDGPAPVEVAAAVTWEEIASPLAALDGSEGPGRIAVPQKAVEELPADPRPPLALARQLRDEGRPQEAIAVLREAMGRGIGEALVALCEMSGDAVREADIAGADPRWSWNALGALLASSPSVASEVLRAAAARALDAPREAWPPPRTVARASLSLQAQRLAGEGIAAMCTASRWAEEDGLDPLGVRGFGIEWIAAHELAGLPPDLDSDIRAAIAQALIAGDLRSCADRLRDLALRHRYLAATASKLLQERAPTLHQTVGIYLASSRLVAPPQVRLGGQGPWRGWATGEVMSTTVASDPDGELELECPRCNQTAYLERHAILRHWPFRAPVRTGDFYVCPVCGGTSRTAGWGFRIASAAGWAACALLLLTAGVSLLWLLTSEDSPSPLAHELDAAKVAMMATAAAVVALFVVSRFARSGGGLPQRVARLGQAGFAVAAVLLALSIARAWQLDPDGTRLELIVLGAASLALGSVPFLCRSGWRMLRRRRPVAFALDERWEPY